MRAGDVGLSVLMPSAPAGSVQSPTMSDGLSLGQPTSLVNVSLTSSAQDVRTGSARYRGLSPNAYAMWGTSTTGHQVFVSLANVITGCVGRLGVDSSSAMPRAHESGATNS